MKSYNRLFMAAMFFGCLIAMGIGIYGLSHSLMAAIALPISALCGLLWAKIELK